MKQQPFSIYCEKFRLAIAPLSPISTPIRPCQKSMKACIGSIQFVIFQRKIGDNLFGSEQEFVETQ
jgi:hypothetical protein